MPAHGEEFWVMEATFPNERVRWFIDAYMRPLTAAGAEFIEAAKIRGARDF